MRRPACSFFFFALSILAAACGGRAGVDISGSGPDSASSDATGGSGSFTVMSDRPIQGSDTGASYSREVSFTRGTASCATTTIGACSVNPCHVSSSGTGAGSAPLPNAGSVNISGAEMTSALLDPQTNGSYVSEVVADQVPWRTGGEMVTLAWAHVPGEATQPGGSIMVGTPPYIALSGDSAFATAPSAVDRTQDLTLAWTSDSPASVLDEVLLDLGSGSTQLTCSFPVLAGTGVVSAAALHLLEAGQGNYDVHSKQYASETLNAADGTVWSVGFNVDAHARASYGLATGSVTIQ
jgi:hypothetical protein